MLGHLKLDDLWPVTISRRSHARERVYGPLPRIAPDTALRLKADERPIVELTYTARRDRVLTTLRRYRCRWCGLGIEIGETDATRHSARYPGRRLLMPQSGNRDRDLQDPYAYQDAERRGPMSGSRLVQLRAHPTGAQRLDGDCAPAD